MSITIVMARVDQLEGMLDTAGTATTGRPPAGFDAALAAAQGQLAAPGPALAFGTSPASGAGPAPAGTYPPPGAYPVALGAPPMPSSPLVASSTSGSEPAPAGAPMPIPAELDGAITSAADRYGLPRSLVAGVARAESGFNPTAQSPAGAQGVMQLMPATARSMGVTDPFDPSQSIDGGARYLSQLMRRFGGNATLAVAGYNAGPNAVARFGGVPPYAETRAYVDRVLGYAAGYEDSNNRPAVTAYAALPGVPSA